MKMKIALSLVAAAVAMLSQGAFAQDKSRAEVKEETKAAVKAGQTKAGEGAPTEKAAKGEKARADVKADAKTAVKAGDTKAGEGKPAAAAPKGEKARADVKADTKKAVKEGTTMPAGEAAPKK